jgi:hypothetical protein
MSIIAPPKKTSAYSRSATFRLGVWALAGAGALILWHGFWDTLEDRSVKLVTDEGIVLEHRSTETREDKRIDRWKQQRLILFLLATGLPMTGFSYLFSLLRSSPATVRRGPSSSPH